MVQALDNISSSIHPEEDEQDTGYDFPDDIADAFEDIPDDVLDELQDLVASDNDIDPESYATQYEGELDGDAFNEVPDEPVGHGTPAFDVKTFDQSLNLPPSSSSSSAKENVNISSIEAQPEIASAHKESDGNNILPDSISMDDEASEGNDEDTTTGTAASGAEYVPPDLSEDDDEIKDDDYVDPRLNQSQKSFFESPLLKALALSALGLMGVAVIAYVMNGFRIASNAGDTNYASTDEEPAEEVTEDDRTEALLKGELALSEQQEANAAYLNGQESKTEAAVEPEPVEAAAVAIEETPAPPLATAPLPAAPVEVEELSELEQWQLAAQQWQIAAQTGSFGNPQISFQTAPQAYPTAPPPTSQVSLFDPSTYNQTQDTVTNNHSYPQTAYNNSPVSSGTGLSIDQMRNSSSTPGLRDAPLTPVLVGTDAEGRLSTDIILSADGSTAASPTDPTAVKYLIDLATPIYDANGVVAIPAEDVLIAVVSNFSTQNGVVQMAATGVLHNNQEYALPGGAILIRADDGGFLVADERGNTNGMASMILPSLFSGLAEAGSALSETSSTVLSSGGTSIATEDSDVDPVGAFASGAFSSLSNRIENNISRSNERASQRPEIWELEQGEAVQIFVNNTFQM